MGVVEEREPWLRRRVKERGAHRGMYMENVYTKSLAWKMRGTKFHKHLQLEFERSEGLAGLEPRGQCPAPGEKMVKNPGADIVETMI